MACTVKLVVHEGGIIMILIRDMPHAKCEIWIYELFPTLSYCPSPHLPSLDFFSFFSWFSLVVPNLLIMTLSFDHVIVGIRISSRESRPDYRVDR